MAVIGVEGVEIRVYKAEELILTLTTDQKGRADTMLEADTYRVEYWFEERKVGEHEITLEVDSFVVWSFPAILMAVELKQVALVEVVGKLGDVVIEEAAVISVYAYLVPTIEHSLVVSIEVVGPVSLDASLTVTVEVVGPVSLEASLTQTVEVA